MVICAGNIQMASIKLTAKPIVTTSGITNMNLPTIPGSSISGRKAAMVVATAAVTGSPTSDSDCKAAGMAAMPRCRRK